MSLHVAVCGGIAKANTSSHGYGEAGPEGCVPRQGHAPNPQQDRLDRARLVRRTPHPSL